MIEEPAVFDPRAALREISIRAWSLIVSVESRIPAATHPTVRAEAASLRTLLEMLDAPR